MTTIVCTKTEMAGDLQMTQRDSIKWKCKTKLFKFAASEAYPPADFIVGFAGTANDMIEAVNFFSSPEEYKRTPSIRNLNGLVLTSKGDIFMFDTLDRWLLVDAPYAAIGSGSMYALGAMSAGASVKEAIKAAGKLDPFTGMGIKTLSF